MAWLSDDFVHPARVELSTGHHIRPIRASDVDIDHPAVRGRGSGCGPSTANRGRCRVEAACDDFVPRWLADTWGFRSVLIDDGFVVALPYGPS